MILADIKGINTKLGDIIKGATYPDTERRWCKYGAFLPRQTGKSNQHGRSKDKRMSRETEQT